MSYSLLIPDLHQDHEFLARVLEREPVARYDRVVLLGDYFDARDPDFRGPIAARKTARMVKELHEQLGERLVLLWGNHDLSYYIAQVTGRSSVRYCGPNWRLGVAPESVSTAQAVAKEWNLDFWRMLKPFVFDHGHLISHAGLHRSFYPKLIRNTWEALRKVENSWNRQMRRLLADGIPGPLMEAGEERGGEIGAVGGLLWLDWNRFVDDLPFPQVVGHTTMANPRQKGRSRCIDCIQCTYALLADDGLVVNAV